MGNFVDMGARLREERERLDYSQADFAGLAGAGRKTQFNYESGERAPDGAYLAAIAEAGADIRYIVTGERSALVLTADERQLLQSYRNGSEELRQAALRMLLTSNSPGVRRIIHGDVNQNIEGNAHFAEAVTFNVGSGKGKNNKK